MGIVKSGRIMNRDYVGYYKTDFSELQDYFLCKMQYDIESTVYIEQRKYQYGRDRTHAK